MHTRGKHIPSPVALAGASGGWAQKAVSTHSEISLCVVGFNLTFLGEQGIGLPEAVFAIPEGSGEGNTKGFPRSTGDMGEGEGAVSATSVFATTELAATEGIPT